MEAIVYFLIFLMGAFIGSFSTLAVYRIPLKQDILYTHSYCPNCKAKLTTLDLVPILSYICLRGKCRHCGNKIRPRYLILEICAGFTTLLFVLSSGLDLFYINVHTLINVAFYLVFITTIILVAGIYKEYNKLQRSVIIFGLVLEIAYLIFEFSIYRLVLMLLLFAMVILLKKQEYVIEFFTLIVYTLFFIEPHMVVFNLILLLFYTLFREKDTLFVYSLITIITLIIGNFVIV